MTDPEPAQASGQSGGEPGAGERGSGPVVARAFHAAFGLVFLVAFLSLSVQIDVLIGSRGVLPIAPFLDALAERPDVGMLAFPTLFRLGASDWVLAGGCWLGCALAALAAIGVFPRACFALLVPLYLSYAVACRDLLSFQWDNLLLECGLLAICLPRDRRRLWIHLLFRFVILKLYFESGIAKWQSPLGDWLDGSAMTFYYETAPIPTWLAWYAHHLPAWWHQLESRATLGVELAVPWLVFGPRPARLLALAVLSGFQIVNVATANYGFFCYLTLALHLFLLDDADLARLRARLPARLRRRPRPKPPGGGGVPVERPRALRVAGRIGAGLLIAFFLGASTLEGLLAFADVPELRAAAAPLRRVYRPFRLVNVYHLFSHVTRERVEPEFQTRVGDAWVPASMWYKPGPLDRAPPFVAPHQPRVDFRLWFYGLGFRRSSPDFVVGLLRRLCVDPEAVQDLFMEELPAQPEAVRIVFAKYAFSKPDESRDESGAYWTRRWVGATREVRCEELDSQ